MLTGKLNLEVRRPDSIPFWGWGVVLEGETRADNEQPSPFRLVEKSHTSARTGNDPLLPTPTHPFTLNPDPPFGHHNSIE
jgi:hypothetical protein